VCVFDAVIVGGALVGASLAAALRSSGLSTALVESAPPPSNAADRPEWDSRIYAISPGSADFLRSCGAWERLDAARIADVRAMRVLGDARDSRIEFDAYDAGLPRLCSIVEGRALQAALDAVLAGDEGPARYAPAEPATLEFGERSAVLGLADGRELETRLVVGADGAQSWVRGAAGIETFERDYHQTAVVANFEAGCAHEGVAWQWFRKDGVLALLPLPGNRVSMVWSTGDDAAAELVAASVPTLERAVETASGNALGTLRAIGVARSFRLRFLKVKEFTRARVALAGDAAHNVHPLAGQGVNLGFQDARSLAQVLAGRGAQDDCGDYRLLRRYERARREDVLAMQTTTDALQRLFNNASPGLEWLRNTGLKLVDQLPKLKNLLIERALG